MERESLLKNRHHCDGKEYEEACQGSLTIWTIRPTDAQDILSESQMDDLSRIKIWANIVWDYLGQIIERANDKNEAIKQQAQVSRPESERPF